MVVYHEQTRIYDIPLPYLTMAHNLRFPSPYSTHVISSDVISRTFRAPSTICTTRLVLKRGKMPAWAPSALYKIGTSWVLEESEVDLEREDGKQFRTRSRNLDHVKALEVFEWQTFDPVEGDPLKTSGKTLTRVTSEFGFWPLPSRIEKFGLSRVPKAADKASAGLEHIATLLLQPSTFPRLLASGPLNPYPFETVPSSLTLAMRAKFDEARSIVARRELGFLDDETEMDLARRGKDDDESSKLSDRSREKDSVEPGRIWRLRWRAAAKRGIKTFRESVCRTTGLLCEEKSQDC
ncbi:BQ5605_C004g02632 [Microbotryum silenes-dioicae]|uniref:BQ5605_C004g02632 protein n=1 Tax=Microbotryum silenes-dioicae TaxID=796604 RepID=A0A2X0MVG8_9BASI|nr:BQ5605_C004g02632 [Microbotryum silenes-dioicae]